MSWKKLQNGSDIRGIALKGVEGENVNLTGEVVEIIGKAFVKWIRSKNDDKDISIAVGTDSRISGPDLKNGFIKGLQKAGVNIVDCGMASTPAMFMSTVLGENPTTAGVMITASHLPFNRNGLKFFTREGGLNKEDISAILEIAEKVNTNDKEISGVVLELDFIGTYSKYLVEYIRKTANIKGDTDKPLSGLKIIVDAGNGAGGFFAARVLEPLGADTSGSQFLDPDGNFSNHVPNPEDKEAMASICNAVIREKADLGIIFDTDVDRSAIVDSEGNPINRNALIALISAVVLEEHPGSTIVTDPITSDGLAAFIEKNLMGKHHRFKRGYKNVINESVRLNEAGEESWLAIETSGHAALKENYFLDDGAFLVAKLLVKMAQLRSENRKLDDLIAKLQYPAESKEFRLNITEDNFSQYGNQVIEQLKELVKSISGWQMESVNHEGIRVKCENSNEQGWFLLRMSLHDPVMPLNIETDIIGGVEKIKVRLRKILEVYNGLNIEVLKP